MNYNYYIDISSLFFIIFIIGNALKTIMDNILEWCNKDKENIKCKLQNAWKIHPLMKKFFSFTKIKKIELYKNETSNFNELISTVSSSFNTIFILMGVAPFILHLIINIFPNCSTSIHYIIFYNIELLIKNLCYIPINYYSNFHIEKKYGFNTMTKKTFFNDIVKNILISMILSLILIPPLNYLLTSFGKYNLLTISVFVFSLIVFSICFEFLYMTIFIRIFNKLEPLKNKKLLNRIQKLLNKYGYNSSMVYVMDSSKRTKKSNAFIGGIGKSKKIVLFDTLLKDFSNDQIISIIGHELAHSKLHHQLISRFISYFSLFIMSIIIFNYIYDINLYHTFGFYWINEENILEYSLIGYLLITLVINSLSWIFDPLLSYISRQCEYSADIYSVKYTNNKEAMISALIKLTAGNYSDIFPNKYYEIFYYSHPSLINRIKKIMKTKKNTIAKK